MKNDIIYPLRRLHGFLYEIMMKIKFFIKCFFPLGKKYFFLATPEHDNLGDSAICISQINFLKSCGIDTNHIKEITYNEFRYKYKIRFFKKVIKDSDVIIFPGGGNMGNQWKNEDELRFEIIENFPNNKILIFPQSIYFTNNEAGNLAKEFSKKYYTNNHNLTIFARDKISFSIMKDLYIGTNIQFCPDIVLSQSLKNFTDIKYSNNEVLLCLRNDAEKSLTDYEITSLEAFLIKNNISYRFTDTSKQNNAPVSKHGRYSDVQNKIKEISSAKLIITDRLHGMIFSAISETPCITLANYSHKIKEAYNTISYIDYIKYANSINEVFTLIPEMLIIKNCKYTNKPILNYYKNLEEVVKNS